MRIKCHTSSQIQMTQSCSLTLSLDIYLQNVLTKGIGTMEVHALYGNLSRLYFYLPHFSKREFPPLQWLLLSSFGFFLKQWLLK